MFKEWRELGQCSVNGNGEFSELGSLNEGNLVEIDIIKLVKVIGQICLFDIEENYESDLIKIKDIVFGVEFGDVLSDDLMQVFDSNFFIDKILFIELLQFLKVED